MTANSNFPHRWRFFRAGGFDQVKIETGDDLMNLDQLDQKLWVALACPITGLDLDPTTAALIDTDRDGRIRAPELLAAVKWAGAMLKNANDLITGGDALPLAAIDDGHAEGKAILAAARQILAALDRKESDRISVADAADANKVFLSAIFNGDGVIVAECASDELSKAVFEEIVACMGTVPDHSGKPGIDQAKADAFFAECAAFDERMRAAERDAARLLPAGDRTAAAAAAVKAIKAKVDDYFGRCRLAAFDPRTAALVNRKEEDYAPILAKDISINAAEVAGFPLAQTGPGRPLPFRGAVNPAHAAALAALRDDAVKPLLGDRAELTEADWATLQERFAPFVEWNTSAAGAAVEKLGAARVRQILGGKARENINALIARDKALEGAAASIANVEKLARFVRDLHRLCINFVNFKNLYAGDAPAVFQAGVLFLDQRSCHLCLTVEDAGRHAEMAGLAGAYLAYVDCARKGTGEKLSIVAIFSQGDDENLMVGRNGLFYDRKGRDFDATITKIIANPISLREAFWSPYKKLVRLIEEHVSKRAATADASVNTQLVGVSSGPVSVLTPTQPGKTAFDLSVVALISIAMGSLAAAFATFLAYLGKFAAWQLPLVFAGIMLIISGPSLMLAFIKLRKRNLGPILDANGWAINSKARINVPFGTSLTGIAKLPPGSSVDIHDKYAEKSAIWPKFLAVLFVIWWIYAFSADMGFLKSWGIPGREVSASENSTTNSPAGKTNALAGK